MPTSVAPETILAVPDVGVDREKLRSRVTVRGKHFFEDGKKYIARGPTYGAFRPSPAGEEYHDLAQVERDFAQMAANGMNAVRIPHTMPPRALLDIAQRHGLRVMVGLSAEQYVGYLLDGRDSEAIEARVREKVRAVAGHPALLTYALGNEIPAGIVRYLGPARVERILKKLYRVVKSEDPESIVTYVNYPTTEYLDLPFLDLISFNVYLEDRESLESYLARLHNIAGDRPLLMSEVGLDSLRNGEDIQAETLDWQIRATLTAGCAGAFIFAWTDEWYRSSDVGDWEFGLTRRDRSPKPALAAVRRAFAETPFAPDREWPRVSVIVCTHNGSRTLRNALGGLERLEYPDYEVIVVEDGSTDRTADIAAEFDVRLIRTTNQGLSAARNTGLRAATGSIVAYLDDDAHPDAHWLHYLVEDLERSDHAGIGGPNIAPPGDGLIAECVANAPGGPVHVLLTDRVAEHIPGCNMAFRREALLAVNGFDPQFRAAGDDVDLCWRFHGRGWTIGFSPSAVVWHHRRNSIRAYWKQQKGYGKAEALLERKWPEKYNRVGHVSWGGRVYGPGLVRALSWKRGRVYQGTWGSAPFQSLYAPATGFLSSLPLMPEWYLAIAILGGLSALGMLWSPLFWALPLLALSVGGVLAQALRSAVGARFPSRPRNLPGLAIRYGITAFLHLIQPAARLAGRWYHGLTPWRRGRWAVSGPGAWAFPRIRRYSIWSEHWQAPDLWLEELEDHLRIPGGSVRRGGDFEAWDLELVAGSMGVARLILAAEDHAGGKQYLRIRSWPVVPRLPIIAFTGSAVLAISAAWAGAGIVGSVLGVAALAASVITLLESGAATAAAARAIRKLEESAGLPNPRDPDSA